MVKGLSLICLPQWGQGISVPGAGISEKVRYLLSLLSASGHGFCKVSLDKLDIKSA